METSKTSFFQLLQDISQVTRRRGESETDYKNLLQKIFKNGGLNDSDSLWEVSSRPRYGNFLRKISKGGLHADPEVEVEHLPIPKVFGREQEMRKLLLKCCNPDDGIQLSAIPIVGAAGIGKTTLARLLYEDKLVLKHFEMRVWVKADGQELNLHDAAQQILEHAMGMLCSVDDPDELDEMVRDTLQWRRCLIVFDGVESMSQDLWLHMTNIWFDSVDLGSIVLITTCYKVVANLVSSEAFELKQVLPDDAWSLYRYLAVGSSSSYTSRNLEALCGYIPLLLKLVGSVMRYDDELRHILSKVNFSDAITTPTFDASVAILLCVWALPPQLRQCLAFCAIFPQGFALNREMIISMWAAYVLVRPSPENNLRDIGDYYFHQLLRRSFFTDIARNEYGDITDFRMPGLIHTTMQDVSCIVLKRKVGVIGSISEDAHQLSLHSKFPEDVSSLTFSSTLYSGGSSSLDRSFLDFQELQSLNLSCSGIRNLSDDISALQKLKYLNLSYTLVERLPDSIMGLPQLQTLDLSWCHHFKFLPKELHNLTYISHLGLSQCESLSYLPSGIGSLKFLTSMPLFVLGKDHDSARLGELGLLNKLRGRLEIRNLENVVEISEAHKAKLNKKKLHHLGLCWSEGVNSCYEVLKLLKPNQEPKFLDLTGYMGFRFPGWISSMSSLIKISITDCRCMKLPSLGQLPLLKELHLKGMINIHSIGPEFYGNAVIVAFPSLEQLGLYDMPSLINWCGPGAIGSGVFCCNLKTLTIGGCPRLEKLPAFSCLLDLIVCNSSVQILSYSNLIGIDFFSSLLIKDMELGMHSVYFKSLPCIKKLILFNSTWYNAFLESFRFTDLEYLGIAHCHQVRHIMLGNKTTIQKLHLVDCPNLKNIYFGENSIKLTELVVDGCPEFFSLGIFSNIHSVTKLIIRGNDLLIRASDFKFFEKLQYLSISECPLLEKELEMEPSPISHVPCVLLGSHKVKHQGSNNPEEYKDAIPQSLENQFPLPKYYKLSTPKKKIFDVRTRGF